MNKHVAHGHVLSPDLDKRLQRVAERMKLSPSEVLDIAVDYFLSYAETEAEWNAEVDDRAREMEETGLHVRHEEVAEWLKRLAAGEDVPPPKPHT